MKPKKINKKTQKCTQTQALTSNNRQTIKSKPSPPKSNLSKRISKKMTFAEVIEKFPEAVEVFMQEGMHCIGCPMSQMETIEQGCKAHGLDIDELINKINKKIKKEK